MCERMLVPNTQLNYWVKDLENILFWFAHLLKYWYMLSSLIQNYKYSTNTVIQTGLCTGITIRAQNPKITVPLWYLMISFIDFGVELRV